MSDAFSTPMSKRLGAKPAVSPVMTAFIHQVDISEIKLEAHSGFLSFQHLKISELCTDPYGEFLEFCRINEHSSLKAEKFGLDIYIQLGSQSNVHASGAAFVSDIVARHNTAHPQFRIIGQPGGSRYLNGDEFVPDFGLTPAGFNATLGPTVVGEIQFATHFVTPQGDEPNVRGCDRKAVYYLRETPHISAFICVYIQCPWPVDGYPKIVLYYFDKPDPNHASFLYQPRRVINIGRVLHNEERNAIMAMYPNLNPTNMFGNGFGTGACHPAADPDHYIFKIPGAAVLYTDPDHTQAAGGIPIGTVDVGIEIDCRVLLNRILYGAWEDDLPINFGPHWPWDPTP